MSESKYRALLASIAASEGRGVDWAAEIEAALAEPPVQAEPAGLTLPNFIRRDVERAIQEAVHPKGMAVHDGIARIGADRLSIMLKVIDHPPAAQANAEPVGIGHCRKCGY